MFDQQHRKQGFIVKDFPLSYYLVFLLGIAATAITCNQGNGSSGSDSVPGEESLTAADPLLRLLDPGTTGIDFSNYIEETFEMNITTHINTSNGGGVAIADINNDDLPDIYFISSSAENKLYLNKGNMQFEDITESAGVSSPEGFEIAVTVVDINTDGYLDFYVCRAGPIENEERRNKLFVNNGDLTFTERAAEYGLDDFSASVGANFFDFDEDGDLDLYLLNYPVDFSYTSKIDVKPTSDGSSVEPNLDPKGPWDSDRFYRNDGPPTGDGKGGFKDVSKEAGIWNFAYGLSVSVEDFNGDGYADVYVGNDFIQPDFLYINNGDGTFTDRLEDYFKHTTQHTMGTELADFDNDGLFDLYAVDMMGKNNYRSKTVLSSNSQSKYTTLINYGYFEPVVRNVLQRNNGNGTFSDIGCMANVFKTDWSWSGLMADLDNDGYKDLTVTNGYRREVTNVDFIDFTFADIKNKGPIKNQYEDVNDFLELIPEYKLRNHVYKNNGDWTFEDKSGEWMTVNASWSNGAANADLDGDGDLDYLVNNIDETAFIYENLAIQKNTGNYLQVKLKGSKENPFGIGAWVRIYYNDNQQYQMMNPTRGIFSSVEHLLHFGLGGINTIDKLIVRWPDGKSQTLEKVNANQKLTLQYTDAKEITAPQSAFAKTIFQDITRITGLDFVHEENPYIDFETYFLLPWKLSDLGPLMATADIDGDGLTDVYVGNAFDKPGGLYRQTRDGRFQLINKEQWESDALFEDHGALFFDADGDNDPDLFVVSGGHEATDPKAWTCRFYLNTGNGSFANATGALPQLNTIGLRAVAHDFDNDGDNDLFLGGRVAAGKYPAIPTSYVLRNDRNRFVDVTETVAPEFSEIGMITDMAWVNIDAEPDLELIIIGEWMPITAFKIRNGKIEKMDPAPLGLDKSNGFWNKLTIADLDEDGDMDLVTGNLGLNSRFEASEATPMQCYASDFDNNGSMDPVLTYYEDGNIYPLVQKDVLIKQMPPLKKKFVYAKDYAKATISDVFSKDQLKNALIHNAYILETCWWENKDGKFVKHILPPQVQVSPVFGILVYDFTGNGHPDILLAGNKHGVEVETGRIDSGIGTLLEGDGKGNFSWVNNTKTGFWATREVRDLAMVKGPDGSIRVIVSNNDSPAQVYSANPKGDIQ